MYDDVKCLWGCGVLIFVRENMHDNVFQALALRPYPRCDTLCTRRGKKGKLKIELHYHGDRIKVQHVYITGDEGLKQRAPRTKDLILC